MNRNYADPICLTGCGWVSPVAAGTIEQVVTTPSFGQQSTDPLMEVPPEFRDMAAKLPSEMKREKPAWLTALAFELCLSDAGVKLDGVDPSRVGFVLGCGWAGQQGMIRFAEEVRKQSARFVSPIHFPQTVGNYVAGAVARGFHLRGPNLTVAGGEFSGTAALMEACCLLDAGDADLVVAGGMETWTPELADLAGRQSDRHPPCEGACLWLLQRSRDVNCRSEQPMLRVTGIGQNDTLSNASDWHRMAGRLGYLESLSGPIAVALALCHLRGYRTEPVLPEEPDDYHLLAPGESLLITPMA